MARGRGYIQNAGTRLARARARTRGGRRGRGKSAMPWDSQAQRESAELGNEGADARSSLAAGYDRAQRELGFGVGAADPYSATGENKKQLTNTQRGIGTTAGNSLYAGSTLNAQSQARTSYDKTQKGLEDEFAKAQTDYTGGVARTTRDEQLARTGIKEGAVGRAAESEPKPLAPGRGRVGGIREGRNVRRPAQARAMNARARAINARVKNNGRGRVI